MQKSKEYYDKLGKEIQDENIDDYKNLNSKDLEIRLQRYNEKFEEYMECRECCSNRIKTRDAYIPYADTIPRELSDILCIDCLEKCMGRELNEIDFKFYDEDDVYWYDKKVYERNKRRK